MLHVPYDKSEARFGTSKKFPKFQYPLHYFTFESRLSTALKNHLQFIYGGRREVVDRIRRAGHYPPLHPTGR